MLAILLWLTILLESEVVAVCVIYAAKQGHFGFLRRGSVSTEMSFQPSTQTAEQAAEAPAPAAKAVTEPSPAPVQAIYETVQPAPAPAQYVAPSPLSFGVLPHPKRPGRTYRRRLAPTGPTVNNSQLKPRTKRRQE